MKTISTLLKIGYIEIFKVRKNWKRSKFSKIGGRKMKKISKKKENKQSKKKKKKFGGRKILKVEKISKYENLQKQKIGIENNLKIFLKNWR